MSSTLETMRRYNTQMQPMRKKKSHSTTTSMLSGENNAPKLISAEKVETGRVKPIVYLKYFQAMGLVFATIFVIGMTANTLASMGRNLWLTDWSNDYSVENEAAEVEPQPLSLRLGVYAGIGFIEGSGTGASSFGLVH